MKKQPRGQTLVLGALGGLLVALALFGVLAVWQAYHRKIELQTAADTAAHSLSLTEARTFNFFATTNRAATAHFAGSLLLYGELSYLTALDASMLAAERSWKRADSLAWAACLSGAERACCPYTNVFKLCLPLLGCLPTPSLANTLAERYRDHHDRAHEKLRAVDLAYERAAYGHHDAALVLADAQGIAWTTLQEVIRQQTVPNSIRHQLDDPAQARAAHGARADAHVWHSDGEAAWRQTLEELTRTPRGSSQPVVSLNPPGAFDRALDAADEEKLGLADIVRAVVASREGFAARQGDPRPDPDLELGPVWANEVNPPALTAFVAVGEAQPIPGGTGARDVRAEVHEGHFEGAKPARQGGSLAAESELVVRAIPAQCTTATAALTLLPDRAAAHVKTGSSSPGADNQPLHRVDDQDQGADGDRAVEALHFHVPLRPKYAQLPRAFPSVARFNPTPAAGRAEAELLNQPSAWVVMEAELTDEPWLLRGTFRFADRPAEYDLSGGSEERRGRARAVEAADGTLVRAEVPVMGALARGLTYYHRPRVPSDEDTGWKEPPNFWNPYWRPKLELWSTGERLDTALGILRRSGFPKAAEVGAALPPTL